MYPRAQVSFFALFFIILIIAVGSTYILLSSGDSELLNDIAQFNQEITPIKEYIDSCLAQTTLDGLKTIGLQGGYYDVPTLAGLADRHIPFYFDKGDRLVPTREAVEKELATYIGNELGTCTKNFEFFKNVGFHFDQQSKVVQTDLLTTVSSRLDFPITVSRKDQQYSLQKFIFDEEANTDLLFEVIEKFSEEHQRVDDSVPIGYITLLAKQYNFTFEISYLPDNVAVYTLFFPSFFEDTSPLLWRFASQYIWENLTTTSTDVEITPIPFQKGYVGYEFSYQVNANTQVTFFDASSSFAIGEKTGEITFIPTQQDAGLSNHVIYAIDDEGNKDSTVLTLIVEGENKNPVLDPIGDLELSVGETSNFYITASDEENHTIVYNIESSLSNLELNPLTGLITFTPQENQVGEYTVLVKVVDTELGQDTREFTIRVT